MGPEDFQSRFRSAGVGPGGAPGQWRAEAEALRQQIEDLQQTADQRAAQIEALLQQARDDSIAHAKLKTDRNRWRKKAKELEQEISGLKLEAGWHRADQEELRRELKKLQG